MITTRHVRGHAKCLAILDMIQTVNTRIYKAKMELEEYDRCDPLSLIRILNDREDLTENIEHHRAVRDRLVKYYVDNLLRLVELPAKHSLTNNPVQK